MPGEPEPKKVLYRVGAKPVEQFVRYRAFPEPVGTEPATDVTRTVSLYLIDGERSVPESLRRAVAALDSRFVDEDPRQLAAGDFHLPGQWCEGDEVWLWLDDETGREIGFAALPIDGGERVLRRVWIEPEFRGRRLLSAAWDEWADRYGEIVIDQPNAVMVAFAERRAVPIR